jgi:adenylate cyclase
MSASNVLNGSIKSGIFADKIVLIGTSAIATYDIKITPFSANMPGVEKNATVIDNILRQDFLKEVPKSINLFAVIVTGTILGFILPRMRALRGTLFSVGFILVYGLTAQALFSYGLLWVSFIYPVTNGVLISITVTAAKYFTEEKKARRLRRIFSSYVSPKIVAEIINNPEKAKLGGERRMVTVLFSDIAGFTSLSESLQPEEVVSIMNEYFKEMAEVIFRWHGTLDKFVGDQIMAFWGAPVAQSNHAELAIRCALHMSKTLDKLHEKWEREGKPILECGIGLNTGEVIVGNIGAEGKKMDYTIIGDHVNIGARVEKLTREFGTRICLFQLLQNLYSEGETSPQDR